MIISHKLKCIYIKNSNVAGTSFEIALSKYCGEDDIITPIGKSGETIRQFLGFCSPQNYTYLVEGKTETFGHHIAAVGIKSLIPSVWDNYLKIATIRCPYDRMISSYYWGKYRKRIHDTSSFGVYILGRGQFNKSEFSFHINEFCYPGIHINGKLITDFLIRHEHLEKDIKELGTKINCSGLLNTFSRVNTKSGIRPSKGTTPCEMYSQYPAAKTKIDEQFYKKQSEYEFIREYWPGYKAKLEEDIAKYQFIKRYWPKYQRVRKYWLKYKPNWQNPNDPPTE